MDEESLKRIERKIDYVAGFIMAAFGIGLGCLIIFTNKFGGWSEWIMPRFLELQHRWLS